MPTMDNLESVADALLEAAVLHADSLHLHLGDCRLCLRSNSAALLTRLRAYFTHVVSIATTADIEVVAIQREAPELGLAFIDWQREPGKTGRKDSYYDRPGFRLVRKVRTGMVFLQSQTRRIAAGPCLRYDNQVINFVNAQYMNWLQQRDWLICHAAGLVQNGVTLGIAGFSGGGKSTLMLHMLENPAVNYLTNDRLFIRRNDTEILAAGIPKLPRINPGTIVHNPRLQSLIPASERQALLALPNRELWDLEEKYDVQVQQLYAPDRITQQAPLAAFLILNWQRDSRQATSLEAVDLAQRDDLLGALMKSPGPFYQFANGDFYQDHMHQDPHAYLQALQGIPVYAATGGIDFDSLASQLLALGR